MIEDKSSNEKRVSDQNVGFEKKKLIDQKWSILKNVKIVLVYDPCTCIQ